MKKISKFLVVALTVALLLGAVIGISAMANDEPAAPAAQAEGSWIISWNVEYNDNLYLMCAIDASKVGEGDELSVDVTFGGIVVDNSGFKIEKSTVQGKAVYKVTTIGVAAKDMADALEIDVKLNGEVVESTSYSVAEYFFQRLYKDQVILATEAAEVAQKELYLSSLKYGNAAQKLLAAADPLYIENTVYLYSTNDEAASLLDASEYLELEDGYYQVKSYVNGKAVESVVDGGKYIIQNSAQITKMDIKTPEYFVPAGATTFDGAAVGTFANATKVGDEAFGTGKQANAVWITEIKVDEATGNKYINHTKSGTVEGATGNQMSWFVVQRTETVAAKEDVYFEARANITITKGTSTHIRLYNSTRTAAKPEDGSPLLASGEYIYIKNSGGYLQIAGKDTGIKMGEWFTLRIVFTTTGYKLYADTQVAENKLVVDKTDLGVDLTSTAAVSYTHQAADCSSISLDNVHFGAKPKQAAVYNTPTNALTFEAVEDGNYNDLTIADDNVKVRHYLYSSAAVIDDYVNGNIYHAERIAGDKAQTYIIFERNETPEAGSTVIFETKMRLSGKNGTYLRFYTNRGTDYNMKDGTAFGSSTGRNINLASNGSAILFNGVNTNIANDAWFVMRLTLSGTTVVGEFFDPTTGKAACDPITVDKSSDWSGKDVATLNSMVFMHDGDYVFSADFESIFFGSSAKYDNGDFTIPEDVDYTVPTLSSVANSTTVTFENADAVGENGSLYAVKNILNNSVVAAINDNNSGAGNPLVRFAPTASGAGKDTVTISFGMRINPNTSGNASYGGTGNGPDFRVRTANSNAKKNVAQINFNVVNGNLRFGDYAGQSGDAFEANKVLTEINAGKWFNVTITYVSKADTVTVTVADDTVSYTITAAALDVCDVSAIIDASVVPGSSFVGLAEFKDMTIAFSSSAAN